jgi:twitching motility protein PilT
MELLSVSQNEVVWPQILLDQIERAEGIILFSGTRKSHPLEVVQAVTRKHPKKRTVVLDKLISKMRPRELEEADIVIYHGPCDHEALLSILDLSEEGRMVVHIVMAPSVISALHKIMSGLVGEAETHLLWRYVDQISLMMNQMHVLDINEQSLAIHEIVMGMPEIKTLILEKKIDEIEKSLKESHEDRGMVSFNQVLLKLLVRRKIDLKTAFLKTRDPENLDELLKKVGI